MVSVPADHPYVRSTTGEDVLVTPDPRPPGAPDGVWWPPVVFDPDWLREHSGETDVLHVHFGVESFTLDHVREVVAALRDTGVPLVVTVHDLANPQLSDQAEHLERTGLLVGAAAEVLTLTGSAADEIAHRWGRRATVVPHPHVLPLDSPLPDVDTPALPVVGVDLKDLRPDVDALGVVDLLAGARRALADDGVEVTVDVAMQDRVRDDARRGRVRDLAASTGLVLTERPRPDDVALHRWLAGLDLAVLPQRHGTHSGWLELCWDLGVQVVVPDVGHHAGQHDPGDGCRPYAAGDPGSFLTAVRGALADGAPVRPGSGERRSLVRARRAWRTHQQAEVAAQVEDAYRRALAARVP